VKCGQLIFVVYDPPVADLPFLSVVFVPGRKIPLVAPFASASEAEQYNKQLALQFAEESEKDAREPQRRKRPRRRDRSRHHDRQDRDP
jgi:hypothetical protein